MENKNVAPIKRSKKQKKKNGKTLIIALIVLAVVCAGVGVVVHFTSRLTNDSYEKCALGDVSGDGKINSKDALSVIEFLVGEKELFDNQKLHADVNQDGEINSSDTLILLGYSVGDITSLPYSGEIDISHDSAGKKKKAVTSTDNLTATVLISNEWENSDGTYSYQLNITMQNTGKYEIDGWKSVIVLSDNVSIQNSWDCSCKMSNKNLTVSGDSIDTHSAMTCGLIVTCEGELTIENIEMR